MNRLAGSAAVSLISLCCLSAPAFACDPKHPEDFTAFFTKFSDDKDFALSRTVYPSVRTRFEYRMEDGKQQITERQRKVARQDDARFPALGEYMKSIGLESKPQEVSKNEAVVEVSKPGIRGLATYHFSLARGCWFLREVQNHSL
jgi:hypothetical protein